jgi:glutaconyl-CoA/methylmalonyl-CoA decarboxylase subunit gamma
MKIVINGKLVEVEIKSISNDRVLFSTQGKSFLVEKGKSVPEKSISQKKPAHPPSRTIKSIPGENSSSTHLVYAPIPGVVAKIFKTQGDSVQAGESILILEAMKMQNRVLAPYDGIIQSICISESEEVKDGQLLFEIK